MRIGKLLKNLVPVGEDEFLGFEGERAKIAYTMYKNKCEIQLKPVDIEPKEFGFTVKCTALGHGINIQQSLEVLDNQIYKVMKGRVYSIKKTEDGYSFNIVFKENIDFKSVENLKLVYSKRHPYNILLGYTEEGKPFALNLFENPHLLVAGTTGTGKTRLVWLALMMCLKIFEPSEFDFIVVKVAKDEFDDFTYCKNCLAVLDLNDLAEMEKYINTKNEEMDKAEARIKKDFGCENIKDYLRRYRKTDKSIRPLFIIIDEFSFLNNLKNSKGKPKEEKELVDNIVKLIEMIVKKGRSIGTYVLAMLQKTTSDQIDSSISSQMTRLTLRQENYTSAKAAIGDEGANRAINLKRQEALIDYQDGIKTIFVPDVDTNIIKTTVGEEKLYYKHLTTLTEEEIIEKYKDEPEEFFSSKPLSEMTQDELFDVLTDINNQDINDTIIDTICKDLKLNDKFKISVKARIDEKRKQQK